MDQERKSLVDNWSLERAGMVLDNNSDYFSLNNEMFTNCLGGLSNYINALLMYDKTSFLENGFESSWQRFPWFKQNTELYIDSIIPTDLDILWKSPESYEDHGISNYLFSSQYYQSDLFISTERSNKILKDPPPKVDDNFCTVLKKIDEKIDTEKDSTWFNDVQIGVKNNFQLPSLTHYVLSQASNQQDLLRVILELKEDGRIKSIRDKISDITTNTKKSFRFQKEIDAIIKNAFGESPKNTSWSIKLSILFLTITKNFNFNFFNRKEHLIFLKNLIATRTEVSGLQNHINRIFKR